MNDHVSASLLSRVRDRTLPGSEILPVLRHLSVCRTCRGAVTPADREVTEVQRLFDASYPRTVECLSPETQVFPYVEGKLGPAETELIESHLDECEQCREDVQDIAALRRLPARSWGRGWQVAAAMAIATSLSLVAWFVSRVTPPEQESGLATIQPVSVSAPQPTFPERAREKYSRPEWNALVDAALEQGRFPRSTRVAALRASVGVLRGGAWEVAGAMEPAGEVIDVVRPLFRWSALDGARYVVTVYRSDDDEEVVHSRELDTAEWICNCDLRRGNTYVWQVEAMFADGATTVLPAPPSPPAKFHVLSQREHDELAAARSQYPNDHLLLAVLSERAGLQEEAKRHLQQIEDGDANVDAVRLRDNITGDEQLR